MNRNESRKVLGLVGLCLAASLWGMTGCEVDSYFDPSRTGRFEYEPTLIPVLERIDAIEQQQDYFANAERPLPQDLIPRELAYYLYPGDLVTLQIFELYQTGQWSTTTQRIDAGGFYRVPELGDVRAAGLTPQEFDEEVTRQLAERIMVNPQVDVIVERSGGLRYSIYGYVQNVGMFTLDAPDLRLLDALAVAGGVPVTTERIYVIRQVLLSDELRAPYEQPGAQQPQTQPGQQQPVDIEDILRRLDEQEENQTQPEAAPGMLQDAPEQQDPPAEPPPADAPIDIDQLEPVRVGEEPPVDVDQLQQPPSAEPGAADSFIYVEERGEWVRVPAQGDQGPPPGPAGGQPPPQLPAGGSPLFATRIIEIDYEALSRGDASYNIIVQPNDLIYVSGPEVGNVYIDGEVLRPGVYQLPGTGRLTLSRLVTAAGGFGAIAIPERVDLVRVVGTNREATIRLNVAAIRQRTEPDVYLKPDDHIIVGTTWYATPLAVIRNGFRATYGFGFLLDRNFGGDVFGAEPVDQQF